MAIPSIEQIIRMRCDGTWHVEIDGVIYVPAIRCKDCTYYDNGVCYLPDDDGDYARWAVEPDGFCSCAKAVKE